MPYVSVCSSTTEEVKKEEFLSDLSTELSKLTGKPETYVMTSFRLNNNMFFAGSTEPCCFVEVKSIGSLNPKLISTSLCSLIEKHTNINPSRIYIHFDDVSPSNWGFNSSTFG